MNILVVNAGSSSLKYQLFDMDDETVLAKGICERIGIDGRLKHTPVINGKPVFDENIPLPTHDEAIAAVIEKLVSEEYGVIDSLSAINAVGHRIVHGGQYFSESALINEEIIKAIDDCTMLAPLHNPANLTGVRACERNIPAVPQVAVFDTAFHQTMPERAYIYPIPYNYFEDYNIRRYGFHGTSHSYVAAQAIEALGGNAEGTKIITCHLGNGSSIAAIKDGKCVDTSMGVTPLEGIPMGTRSGSIDPTIVELLAGIEGTDVHGTMDILNKKSGMLGVSGISSDFRDLQNSAVEGNKRAALALDIFNYNIIKYIGSCIAVMGGVDAIVFTAGIGENDDTVRAGVIDGLAGFGIEIDKEANQCRGVFRDISAEGSTARVLIIPTNEELVIARDTKNIVAG